MRNTDIRAAARESAVYLWEVAERMGITDATLSRRLRHELPETEKRKMLELISNIAENREEG